MKNLTKEEYVAHYESLKNLPEEEKLDLDISELGLSTIIFHALARAGIMKVRDISSTPINKIKKINGIGNVCYRELEYILDLIGITLVGNEEIVIENHNKLLSKKERIIQKKEELLEELQKLQLTEAELDTQIELSKQELEKLNIIGYNGKQKTRTNKV